MKLSRTTIVAFCILFATCSLNGCQDKKTTKNTTKPVPVKTLTATATAQPYWVDVFGQTEGEAAVIVHPQITGPVLKRTYTEGHPVKKGDVLFVIDPAPFQASYDSARAEVQLAKATVEKNLRESKRFATLWQKRAVSEKQYTDAQSDYLIAKANLLNAQAKAREASISLGYTKVRAPVDGIAGRALVNPGTLVNANTTALTDITQDKNLKVRFSVSERDLHGYTLTAKTPVTVINKTIKEKVEGTLDFASIQIDPQTGTRSLSAKLEKSDLLPGQYVTVRLILGIQPNVFLVPQSAILQLSDGSYAVFVKRDGKARQQKVTVGRWLGKDWIVTSGLKDGELVIIDQIQKLKDRMSVVPATTQKD